MRFKSIVDGRSNVGLQGAQIFRRLRSQDDLKAHSGQIIAKTWPVSKSVCSNARLQPRRFVVGPVIVGCKPMLGGSFERAKPRYHSTVRCPTTINTLYCRAAFCCIWICARNIASWISASAQQFAASTNGFVAPAVSLAYLAVMSYCAG